MLKMKMIFVDPDKAKKINNIWKAKIDAEKFDRSLMKSQKIIGIKEDLECPICEP
ncbi:MAG: hypothetical protein ABIH80_04070 [Methanobacteriota archaeon]